MPLTVGALARRTRLTVRALHHYDEIGLLKPSARSDAGYRLYGDADVARLHAIQALRHLGLPLAEIGPLLDQDAGQPPERILEQQMVALDHQIRQATELRGQLALLRDNLRKGQTPTVDDWVQSLSLMATWGRHFSADELRMIFGDYGAIEAEWEPLKREVRACMDSGAPPDGEAAQVLTRRWMALMHRWMKGDFALMERWGAMYRQEPSAHGLHGAPATDMLEYMERAVTFRLGLLQQYYAPADPRDVHLLPDAGWLAIERAGRKLIAEGRAPTCKAARTLHGRWLALADEMAGGNAVLRAKLLAMHLGHPLLLAGAPLSREVRAYLSQA